MDALYPAAAAAGPALLVIRPNYRGPDLTLIQMLNEIDWRGARNNLPTYPPPPSTTATVYKLKYFLSNVIKEKDR